MEEINYNIRIYQAKREKLSYLAELLELQKTSNSVKVNEKIEDEIEITLEEI